MIKEAINEKTKLSEKQVQELKTAFTDGDVQVSRLELKTLHSKLDESVDDELIDEIIKIADLNRDGKIDFNEFVKANTE